VAVVVAGVIFVGHDHDDDHSYSLQLGGASVVESVSVFRLLRRLRLSRNYDASWQMELQRWMQPRVAWPSGGRASRSPRAGQHRIDRG
jgi:hypothetical protein